MNKVMYAVVYHDDYDIETICETRADAEEYCLAWGEYNLWQSCLWDLHYWDLTETMEENIENLWNYVRETRKVKNLLFYTCEDIDIIEIPVY